MGEALVGPKLRGELGFVVQEQGLGMATEREGHRVLLPGEPVLDLVPERDRELQVLPDRVGGVGPAVPGGLGEAPELRFTVDA